MSAPLESVAWDYHSDTLKGVAMVAGSRMERAAQLSVCTHQPVRPTNQSLRQCHGLPGLHLGTPLLWADCASVLYCPYWAPPRGTGQERGIRSLLVSAPPQTEHIVPGKQGQTRGGSLGSERTGRIHRRGLRTGAVAQHSTRLGGSCLTACH